MLSFIKTEVRVGSGVNSKYDFSRTGTIDASQEMGKSEGWYCVEISTDTLSLVC